jgi:hypothetical protein
LKHKQVEVLALEQVLALALVLALEQVLVLALVLALVLPLEQVQALTLD